MPRPAHVARRRDAAVGQGAHLHPALATAPDTGLLRRLWYRIGRSDTVRLWGREIHVPAHRLASHWLWAVRQQTYERDEASALLHLMDPRLPLLELGGGFGAISVLANSRLDRPEEHVVVEMDPELVGYLEKNRARHRLAYEVVHAAVAPAPMRVERRIDFVGQQAVAQGGDAVPHVTPPEIVARRGWGRINLFMDIEGMETDLVEAFPEFFRDHVEVLVLETHGHKAPTGQVAALPLRLRALGLEPVWTRNRVWGYRAP